MQNYIYDTNPRKVYESENQVNTKKRVVKKDVKKSASNVRTFNTIITSIGVGLLLIILTYQNAIINIKLTERENIKNTIKDIEKTNVQLQVSIEKSIDVTQIEKIAKEKLGMQKLNNSQKVYISIDKKNYFEVNSK